MESIKDGLTVEKEKLIEELLKLGGEGYSRKDLRNDLIRMEESDNRRGLEQSQEPLSSPNSVRIPKKGL